MTNELPFRYAGINIVAFYSSTIFVEAGGYTARQALFASLGFGAVK